jgi:hypothetical protein
MPTAVLATKLLPREPLGGKYRFGCVSWKPLCAPVASSLPLHPVPSVKMDRGPSTVSVDMVNIFVAQQFRCPSGCGQADEPCDRCWVFPSTGWRRTQAKRHGQPFVCHVLPERVADTFRLLRPEPRRLALYRYQRGDCPARHRRSDRDTSAKNQAGPATDDRTPPAYPRLVVPTDRQTLVTCPAPQPSSLLEKCIGPL